MTLKETLHLGGHHHPKNTNNDSTASKAVSPTSPTNGHEVERTDTMSSTEAIPKGGLPDTASTLEERLRAWKHVVGMLEEYVEQHEHLYKAIGKEYEKVGKVCWIPPIRKSALFLNSRIWGR